MMSTENTELGRIGMQAMEKHLNCRTVLYQNECILDATRNGKEEDDKIQTASRNASKVASHSFALLGQNKPVGSSTTIQHRFTGFDSNVDAKW